MTLKGHYALWFKTRASFGAHHEKLNKDRLYCQRRRCSGMTLDSGNIRFMRIFAVVLKIYKFSWIYAFARILRIHVPHAFFVIKFNCCCLLQLSVNGCSGKVKCGLAEMWQVKRISEMSSAECLESAERLWIFCRRYIVRILTNKANISICYYLFPYRLSTESKTRDLEWPFCVKFCFAPVRVELWSLTFEAWLL